MCVCVYRSPWAEVGGTKYCQHRGVVLDCGLVPKFGIIHDIILNDLEQPFLVCEKLLTDCFHYHYHSYKVVHTTPPVFYIKKPSALYDHIAIWPLKLFFEVPRTQEESADSC